MCRVCQIILKVCMSLIMLCFLILGLLKFYPKEHVDYQDTQGNDFNQSVPTTTIHIAIDPVKFNFFFDDLSDLALVTKEHFAPGPTLSYFR